jgi:hypothetical protein
MATSEEDAMQRSEHVIKRLILSCQGRLEQIEMLLLIGAVGSGCASGRLVPSVSQQADASQATRLVSSTPHDGAILPPEIRAASTSTAYDAILKLRPGFLTGNRSMGSGRTAVRPSVVLEKGIPEPLDVLRLVSVDDVAEIRFIEPMEATLHYGPAYTAGVIVVRLALTSRPFD